LIRSPVSAQNVTTLVNRGYSISPRQPEYYVSNLPELRVQLLGKAVADAKARATEIAKSGGASVGPLQSASSGVVQVLAPNSHQYRGLRLVRHQHHSKRSQRNRPRGVFSKVASAEFLCYFWGRLFNTKGGAP